MEPELDGVKGLHRRQGLVLCVCGGSRGHADGRIKNVVRHHNVAPEAIAGEEVGDGLQQQQKLKGGGVFKQAQQHKQGLVAYMLEQALGSRDSLTIGEALIMDTLDWSTYPIYKRSADILGYCNYTPDESDVYVIATTDALECFGASWIIEEARPCHKVIEYPDWGTRDGELVELETKHEQIVSFRTTSRKAMIDHLRGHRWRRHLVPEYAFSKLREEIKEKGDIYPNDLST